MIKYKTYRNKLRHILLQQEKNYYAELLKANRSNMKKTWSILKSVVNKGIKRQVQAKFKMNDGSITNDKVLISEKFNDFFTGVGPSLAKKIPTQVISPLHYMGNRVQNSIFLEPVHPSEIDVIMKDMKNSAPGHDGITLNVLKLSLSSIKTPLTHILNISLSEGVFPEELKIANVIPLFKADDPMLFNNYRPVSLLCVLSKVFEKIMYSRLMSFLEFHKILYHKQFGFRKKHSTYMAIMILLDKLINSIENGETVVGVYLDFSKAFDTVVHNILLTKLYHYGIRGNALQWFKSYMSERKQFVSYNGTSSSMKTVCCGVPQGSILGPILFLLYINDLSNVCKNTEPFLFADDSNLFISDSDPYKLQSQLNNELENISLWLKVNKLSLNIKKTHYMVFTRKRKITTDISLNIDGNLITEVSSTKFLGVYLDNKLTWKKHIDYITAKVSRGFGLISKAQKLLNADALLTLYYSFLYPYLCYCNHVWGSTYVSNLQKLIVLQKKIIRMISGSRFRDHTDPLFKNLSLIKFVDLNKYMIGRFMFRYHVNDIPHIFEGYFSKISDIHDYGTRTNEGLYAKHVKSDLGKTSVSYRGPIIWNMIKN